jgi:hypothetical protein
MTLWQDPPPQTRRQARESERAAAQRADSAATSRRAATVTPTPAGEIPQVTTPFVISSTRREATTDTLEAPSDAPVVPMTAPQTPPYQAMPFEAVLNQPPAAEDVFRPAADPSQPEPVTAPVQLARQQSAAPGNAAEHTLTRRELRAMLLAQEAVQKAAEPSEPAVERASEPSTASGPSVASGPAQASPVADRATPEGLATPITASPVSFEPVPVPHSDQADDAPANPEPSAADDTQIHHRRSFQPPTGHWSLAAERDDDDDQATPPGGISRSAVSSGVATTSNALIMPIVPSVADATGPLTSTGEVLITGSIDLPRGLGSTGQHPDHFDTSDLDHMFDQPDAIGDRPANAAPVRASRAVSTHTSTRGMITPPKSRGAKLPMILAITAAVLAIGVVGLLVAGYVFHAF